LRVPLSQRQTKKRRPLPPAHPKAATNQRRVFFFGDKKEKPGQRNFERDNLCRLGWVGLAEEGRQAAGCPLFILCRLIFAYAAIGGVIDAKMPLPQESL
jgi:hypothetical protein